MDDVTKGIAAALVGVVAGETASRVADKSKGIVDRVMDGKRWLFEDEKEVKKLKKAEKKKAKKQSAKDLDKLMDAMAKRAVEREEEASEKALRKASRKGKKTRVPARTGTDD